MRVQIARNAGPHHDRRDHVAGPCGQVIEPAAHRLRRQDQAQLFVQFAQRRLLGRLAGVNAAARQCKLSGVGAQGGRTQGHQHSGLFTPVARPKRQPRQAGTLPLVGQCQHHGSPPAPIVGQSLNRPPLQPLAHQGLQRRVATQVKARRDG
jgi:hypothetical protein